MAGYTEQRLIPFPSFLFPYFFEQWSSLHLFFISRNAFSLIIIIREKAFREMKKDVGMTTAQKSKETRRMESLFCISSQQSLHIRRVASDYSVVMYAYVGIVGWIYRTKIPSFLFPYFFEQWSSLHLFSFHEMLFPLLVPGLFSSLLWF